MGLRVTMSPFATGNISIPNDFDFADDMVPSRCPFFAHIRKMNPRGDTKRLLGGTDKFERSHRLTRRGIPLENAAWNRRRGRSFPKCRPAALG